MCEENKCVKVYEYNNDGTYIDKNSENCYRWHKKYVYFLSCKFKESDLSWVSFWDIAKSLSRFDEDDIRKPSVMKVQMLHILLRFRRGMISIEFCFLGYGIPKTFDVPTSRFTVWQTLFWERNSDSSRVKIQKHQKFCPNLSCILYNINFVVIWGSILLSFYVQFAIKIIVVFHCNNG